MDLKKIIKDNIITPSNSNKNSNCVGTITHINLERMYADVLVKNQFGIGEFNIKATIQQYGNGINLNNYNVGDQVVLCFMGNSLSSATILGLSNEYRITSEQKYHYNQEISREVNKVKKKYNLNMMDIISSKEDKLSEFISNYELSSNAGIDIERTGCYRDGDIGITHPENKSTVKIKSNGDIIISSHSDNIIKLTNDGNLIVNAKKIKIYTDEGIEKNGGA